MENKQQEKKHRKVGAYTTEELKAMTPEQRKAFEKRQIETKDRLQKLASSDFLIIEKTERQKRTILKEVFSILQIAIRKYRAQYMLKIKSDNINAELTNVLSECIEKLD